MKKKLRPYQQACCKELHSNMHKPADPQLKYPYASVMTGLGKSLIIAALINRYINEGKRVLCLVPRLELVEQNYKEAFEYCDNKQALGVVCGQLQKKQTTKQAIIAMSSSFVNSRNTSGKFDYLILDECHRLHWKPDDQKTGTIQKIIISLLRQNPNMKVCGVSGTTYRLDQGELHETSHKAWPFFTHKVYDTSIDPGLKSLIEEGYLSHIETLNTNVRVDLDGVRLSGDDFNKDAAGVKFDAIIDDAVEDMRKHFVDNDIKTAIIFTSTLKNARHILNKWGDNSTMRIVCGDDSLCTKSQRKDAVNWIKNGNGCRYIVNVDILTEGFDHRALDCVVLLRATTSPGLLIQMVGRVIRPHDDKECGWLIDYGTNIERLTTGGIENIIVPRVKKKRGDAPKKICLAIIEEPVSYDGVDYKRGDACNYLNILTAKKCKVCGAEFISESEDGLYTMRTKSQALALKQESLKETIPVKDVLFELAYSKKDQTPMIKILFYDEYDSHIINTYMCLDHQGQAKGLATAQLMSLMKDKKNYYQLAKVTGGTSVKAVLYLFEYNYDDFFKRVKTVTVTEKGRFKELVGWSVE